MARAAGRPFMNRALAARPHPALLYARFLKIEHTLFSLPLIFAGALLAGGSGLNFTRALWILVAGAGARTAAMGLNRIIDRHIDAENPRTAGRELPSGAMSMGEAWTIVGLGILTYVTAAAILSPLCLWLSPIPLAVFVLYPYLKRVTPLCHFGVGFALALAPLGGWLAVAPIDRLSVPDYWLPPVLLSAFTFFWVAGFDIIYATLDEDFDRAHGIRSLPATLGRRNALAIAALLHVCGVATLAFLLHRLVGHWVWWLRGNMFLGAIALLFALEHWFARNVNLAFFKINVLVGFAVCGFVVAVLIDSSPL